MRVESRARVGGSAARARQLDEGAAMLRIASIAGLLILAGATVAFAAPGLGNSHERRDLEDLDSRVLADARTSVVRRFIEQR